MPRLGRIAGLGGRATGGITFDDEQLALARVGGGAVAQLVGHACTVEQRLAAHRVAGVLRGDARTSGLRSLRDRGTRFGGVLLEPLGELVVRGPFNQRAHRHVAELALGLAFELRLAKLHRDDGRQTLTNVFALKVLVLFLE